jgi:hypothetical protein
MQKTMILQNNHVNVLWQQSPEMIVVTNLKDHTQAQPFAGYDGLLELFNTYSQSFNKQTDYETSIIFF